MSDERKKYVTETAEGLKYHLKLGMDNLSAKMAASRSALLPIISYEICTKKLDRFIKKNLYSLNIKLSSFWVHEGILNVC